MAIPGFTADESIGPTLQVYRSTAFAQHAQGLSPQSLDTEAMGSDDDDDADQDNEGFDDDGDVVEGGSAAEEESSSGDA